MLSKEECLKAMEIGYNLFESVKHLDEKSLERVRNTFNELISDRTHELYLKRVGHPSPLLTPPRPEC